MSNQNKIVSDEKSTVVTLILPNSSAGIARSGSAEVLLRRGTWAVWRRFDYHSWEQIMAGLRQAENELVALEIEAVDEATVPAPTSTPAEVVSTVDVEPTETTEPDSDHCPDEQPALL